MFSPLRQSIALVCVSAVLGQSVLAHSAESSVWKERRQARQQVIPLLTSLPAAHSFLPRQNATSSALVRPESTPVPPLKTSRLQLYLEAAAQSPVQIQSLDAGRPDKNPVILIQDIHLHAQAQTHIAKFLLRLMDQQLVTMVGVEGAFAPFDFQPLRRFKNKTAMQEVADAFVANNLMAGPSYAGVVSNNAPPSYFGVDDPIAYESNVKAYLDSRASQKTVLTRLVKEERNLNEVKEKTLNPRLLRFDWARSSYRSGSISFGMYLGALDALSTELNLESQGSHAIDRFVAAHAMESKMDFARVERERRVVLEKLGTTLTEKETNDLLGATLAYRNGERGFGDYHRYLKQILGSHGVDLRPMPAFDDYLRYVLLADGIKAEELFAEVARREQELIDQLSVTPEERRLMDAGERVYLSGKLARFEMTPVEWATYKEVPSASSLVPSKDHLGTGSQELGTFEEFYRLADLRSQKITAALLQAPASAGARVLIVGGFHTPDIADDLKAAGHPLLVVSPRLTAVSDDAASSYLTAFERDKSPLDRLFETNKVTIALRGVAVGAPSAGDANLLLSAAGDVIDSGEERSLTIRGQQYQLRKGKADTDERQLGLVAMKRDPPNSNRSGRVTNRVVVALIFTSMLMGGFFLGLHQAGFFKPPASIQWTFGGHDQATEERFVERVRAALSENDEVIVVHEWAGPVSPEELAPYDPGLARFLTERPEALDRLQPGSQLWNGLQAAVEAHDRARDEGLEKDLADMRRGQPEGIHSLTPSLRYLVPQMDPELREKTRGRLRLEFEKSELLPTVYWLQRNAARNYAINALLSGKNEEAYFMAMEAFSGFEAQHIRVRDQALASKLRKLADENPGAKILVYRGAAHSALAKDPALSRIPAQIYQPAANIQGPVERYLNEHGGRPERNTPAYRRAFLSSFIDDNLFHIFMRSAPSYEEASRMSDRITGSLTDVEIEELVSAYQQQADFLAAGTIDLQEGTPLSHLQLFTVAWLTGKMKLSGEEIRMLGPIWDRANAARFHPDPSGALTLPDTYAFGEWVFALTLMLLLPFIIFVLRPSFPGMIDSSWGLLSILVGAYRPTILVNRFSEIFVAPFYEYRASLLENFVELHPYQTNQERRIREIGAMVLRTVTRANRFFPGLGTLLNVVLHSAYNILIIPLSIVLFIRNIIVRDEAPANWASLSLGGKGAGQGKNVVDQAHDLAALRGHPFWLGYNIRFTTRFHDDLRTHRDKGSFVLTSLVKFRDDLERDIQNGKLNTPASEVNRYFKMSTDTPLYRDEFLNNFRFYFTVNHEEKTIILLAIEVKGATTRQTSSRETTDPAFVAGLESDAARPVLVAQRPQVEEILGWLDLVNVTVEYSSELDNIAQELVDSVIIINHNAVMVMLNTTLAQGVQRATTAGEVVDLFKTVMNMRMGPAQTPMSVLMNQVAFIRATARQNQQTTAALVNSSNLQPPAKDKLNRFLLAWAQTWSSMNTRFLFLINNELTGAEAPRFYDLGQLYGLLSRYSPAIASDLLAGLSNWAGIHPEIFSEAHAEFSRGVRNQMGQPGPSLEDIQSIARERERKQQASATSSREKTKPVRAERNPNKVTGPQSPPQPRNSRTSAPRDPADRPASRPISEKFVQPAAEIPPVAPERIPSPAHRLDREKIDIITRTSEVSIRERRKELVQSLKTSYEVTKNEVQTVLSALENEGKLDYTEEGKKWVKKVLAATKANNDARTNLSVVVLVLEHFYGVRFSSLPAPKPATPPRPEKTTRESAARASQPVRVQDVYVQPSTVQLAPPTPEDPLMSEWKRLNDMCRDIIARRLSREANLFRDLERSTSMTVMALAGDLLLHAYDQRNAPFGDAKVIEIIISRNRELGFWILDQIGASMMTTSFTGTGYEDFGTSVMGHPAGLAIRALLREVKENQQLKEALIDLAVLGIHLGLSDVRPTPLRPATSDVTLLDTSWPGHAEHFYSNRDSNQRSIMRIPNTIHARYMERLAHFSGSTDRFTVYPGGIHDLLDSIPNDTLNQVRINDFPDERQEEWVDKLDAKIRQKGTIWFGHVSLVDPSRASQLITDSATFVGQIRNPLQRMAIQLLNLRLVLLGNEWVMHVGTIGPQGFIPGIIVPSGMLAVVFEKIGRQPQSFHWPPVSGVFTTGFMWFCLVLSSAMGGAPSSALAYGVGQRAGPEIRVISSLDPDEGPGKEMRAGETEVSNLTAALQEIADLGMAASLGLARYSPETRFTGGLDVFHADLKEGDIVYRFMDETTPTETVQRTLDAVAGVGGRVGLIVPNATREQELRRDLRIPQGLSMTYIPLGEAMTFSQLERASLSRRLLSRSETDTASYRFMVPVSMSRLMEAFMGLPLSEAERRRFRFFLLFRDALQPLMVEFSPLDDDIKSLVETLRHA